MLFYNIIFIVLLGLSFIELFCYFPLAYKKITAVLLMGFWAVCSALYAGPMGDFQTYRDFFGSINTSHMNKISEGVFEYCYELLSYLIRNFTDEYACLRLVLALIVMFFWYIIVFSEELGKKGQYAITILFVLWSLNFGNIFVIRSTIAVAICVYSIIFIEKNEKWKFLACFVLAMGFHSMSILWLFAYVIYKRSRLRKIYFWLIAITILFSSAVPVILLRVSRIFGDRIYSRIYSYISYGVSRTLTTYDYTFTILKAMINMILLLVLFAYMLYRKKKANVISNEEGMYNLFVAGSLVHTIALFSSMALSRVALLFNATQYVLLPRIFDLLEFKKKRFNKFIVWCICSLYLYLRFLINVNSSDYVPFQITK
ncbi:MAG: EpsG family protein [Lachnospiraceae bacterium]|nr:EpsG family protein [Lachnospiraceae bacterium]